MNATPEQFWDKTIEFWQPHTTRRLTREDARQIVENLTGYFDVLRDWATEADIQVEHGGNAA